MRFHFRGFSVGPIGLLIIGPFWLLFAFAWACLAFVWVCLVLLRFAVVAALFLAKLLIGGIRNHRADKRRQAPQTISVTVEPRPTAQSEPKPRPPADVRRFEAPPTHVIGSATRNAHADEVKRRLKLD